MTPTGTSTGTARSSRRSSVPSGTSSASGRGGYAPLNSQPVCVNPGSAFNCYWEMPFRKSARVTMTNIGDEEMTPYHQVI